MSCSRGNHLVSTGLERISSGGFPHPEELILSGFHSVSVRGYYREKPVRKTHSTVTGRISPLTRYSVAGGLQVDVLFFPFAPFVDPLGSGLGNCVVVGSPVELPLFDEFFVD